MDSLLSWIGLASLVLLVVASAVAWWEHRQRINQLRRDLALVENSRFQMEEQLRSVDARLQSMQVRMEAQKVQRAPAPVATAAAPAPLPAAPRPGLQAATVGESSAPPARLAAAPATASRPGRPQVWADTLPMESLNRPPPVHYEPTRPMELRDR